MKGSTEPTVLIVEDESALSTLLRYNLEREGYRVFEAKDGEEALLLADEAKPDLVLLDWMLPQLSGIEVCRRLRSRGHMRNVPIVMLTARGEEPDRIRGLDTGADDYIVKPCDPGEILARVRVGLRTAQLARELREKMNELHALSVELDEVRAEARRRPVLELCPACRRAHTPDGWDDLYHHLFDSGLADWSLAPCPECELAASRRAR
jgi:DNA-binding response OmpR family regulator